MIKRQLLATVSCLALTGAASAADMRMPVKAAPAPVVTQIWAGPYIGINGGAVWHRMTVDTVNNFGPGGTYDTAKVTATGGTVGGQIGYNFVSQNFLYGLEADLNWVHAEDSRTQMPVVIPLVYTTKLSWLGTVRARAGVTFGPNLLFITGGLAVGGIESHWNFAPGQTCGPGNTICGVTIDKTKVGWTAGGGIERFISNNVTAKAEVLYVDLGRSSGTSLNGSYTSRFKNTSVLGRLGLNLKW